METTITWMNFKKNILIDKICHHWFNKKKYGIFFTLSKTQKLYNRALSNIEFMSIIIFIFLEIAIFEHWKNHPNKISNRKIYQFKQSAKGILWYMYIESQSSRKLNVMYWKAPFYKCNQFQLVYFPFEWPLFPEVD